MVTRIKPRLVKNEENNFVGIAFTTDRPYFGFQVEHNTENPTFENCFIGIGVERSGEEDWSFAFKIPAENFLNDLLTSYTHTGKSLKVYELKRDDLFTLHLRLDEELFVAEGFHLVANEVRKILIRKYGYWKLQKIRMKKYIHTELRLYIDSYVDGEKACEHFAQYCLPGTFKYDEFISDLDEYKSKVKPVLYQSGGEIVGFAKSYRTNGEEYTHPIHSRKEYDWVYPFEELFYQKFLSVYPPSDK